MLETWQIEDAARLKSAFKLRTKLSQEQFGAKYLNVTQGMIWQYLNAKRALNLDALIGFCDGLDIDPFEISPTLANQLKKIPNKISEDTLSDLSLIQMMDLKLSAGTGNIVFEIDGSRKIAFRTEYLKKRGIKPENAFGFHVEGESMIDVGIHDGGMVAVNRAIKDPRPNKFYGMWIEDKYMVKEIVKRVDGYYAISHNAAKKHKYPDRLIDSENSGIIGQVFWCGFEL